MVRVGIIGFGNMGRHYYEELSAGLVPGAVVTAVYTGSAEKKRHLAREVTVVSAVEALLELAEVDAVLVTTPNHTHAAITKKALARGKHVLVEKPVGLNLDEVEELTGLAASRGLSFAVMFQMRADPVFMAIKKQLSSLGQLERISWQVTQYYRPQSYYDGSRSWTGRWQTDGGGVLLNQAIHQLDLWQYLFGMPDQVVSKVRFGAFRDIEVEDQATVMLVYEDGLTGTFMATVNEADRADRLEIVGAQGTILLADHQLRIRIGEQEEVVQNGGAGVWKDNRLRLVDNFVKAITGSTGLISPAGEGRNSLELVFAAWLSTWNHRWVSLPVDRSEVQKKISQKEKTDET